MEKALKKAKQDRETNLDSVEPNKAAKSGTQSIAASSKLQEIEYSETRRFDVSDDELSQNRVVAGLKNNRAADSYKFLRTRLLKTMRANNWNMLGITSPAENSGKSLTAINLAISLSLEVNHTVLLVDLDLRNPSIHKYFGLKPKYGIMDHLIDDVPLNEILINPTYERLVVLPGNGRVDNSSEWILSPKTKELLRDLKNRYATRYVIYDLPPILSSDDTIAFEPNTDCTLMVVEEGGTTKAQLADAMRLIDNEKLIGTVLNKAHHNSFSYGYYR